MRGGVRVIEKQESVAEFLAFVSRLPVMGWESRADGAIQRFLGWLEGIL